MSPPPLTSRETYRAQRFEKIWSEQLNEVFSDVARYYDRGNQVASFGLMNWLLGKFMSIVDVHPGERVLDVCAGTNAIGIALLKREPGLHVHAIDRSASMQEVGQQRAKALGFTVASTIHDVHDLPFPDNHFDVVTLQFASRHLRIEAVFDEIHRVLKPGGRFYHSDMLRPESRLVKRLYFAYLRFSVALTAYLFGSGAAAHNCREYFIDALDNFYSAEEMSEVLRHHRFTDVLSKKVLGGMVGYHRAVKPADAGGAPAR